MVTLKDIAIIANVSTSTASRALNNDPRISPEQTLRIQRIAQEQNYIKHKIRKPEGKHDDIWKDAGIIVPENCEEICRGEADLYGWAGAPG